MSHEDQGEYTETDGMQRLDEDEATGSYVDEHPSAEGEASVGEDFQGGFTQMQDASGAFDGETLGEAGSYTDANEQ